VRATLTAGQASRRATALKQIVAAFASLDRGGGIASAFTQTIYNRPRAALRYVEKAERHLSEARRALRQWARSYER
jgi:hypothetical protein